MKIVYVITRSEPMGGAQVHVRDLALALTREGHHVTVLTGGTGQFTDELADAGVAWLSVPHLQFPIHPISDARAFLHIRAMLRRLKPDLIATHSSKAGVLGRLAGYSLRVPVTFTAHGWAFTPGVPQRTATLYRWLERSVSRFAARIITVSDFDRDLAIRKGVAPGERVVTIHNGVPDVAPQLRARPSHSPARLVMVARFEAQKDHRTLLESLAGLTDLGWELDLLGEGPLLPAIRSLSESLGLAHRVHFWGARRDVAERLAQAQVFLLISSWEGFPYSVLEAMRAAMPVIASDVGGVREAVESGETGVLIPRGDVETLRGALRRLLSDPELRDRLGREGRRRYEERFRLEHTISKTIDVYREVLTQLGRIETTSVELRSARSEPSPQR